VTPCDTCADIGCDHGRFGAVLLWENRCRRLLAADVSEQSLGKAKARLTRLGLGDRTVFAVAAGLNALDALPEGRADTVCILGMGGETVAGILNRGAGRLNGAALIVGAQTELPLTRNAIQQSGYALADERVVDADGRLYLLLRALARARRFCALHPPRTAPGALPAENPAAFVAARGSAAGNASSPTPREPCAPPGGSRIASPPRRKNCFTRRKPWRRWKHTARYGTPKGGWLMTVGEIYDWLDRFAPFDTQAEFDNSGLLLGDPAAEAGRVLFALDATLPIVREAAKLKQA
jgi:tRNA A22 N-methylase